MVTKEAINWVKKAKLNGYTEDQIRVLLTKQGYSSKEVKDLIPSIKKSNNNSLNIDNEDDFKPKKFTPLNLYYFKKFHVIISIEGLD
jgi:hypothetical protein